MDIKVTFPGGKRVDAHFGNHVVRTDQPASGGGEDSAPAPFDLFLASVATCAGIYVVGFCQARGIPTDGIDLVQKHSYDEAGKLSGVEIELTLPASFPEKYRTAVVNAAANCKVKKVIATQPPITVKSVIAGEAAAAPASA
jgi:ribosomal protein S12 methylthiotransferase accessory factor